MPQIVILWGIFKSKKEVAVDNVTIADDGAEYTPEVINSLADNEVFVFGSNLRGWHQGGATKHAQRYGSLAKWFDVLYRRYAFSDYQGSSAI